MPIYGARGGSNNSLTSWPNKQPPFKADNASLLLLYVSPAPSKLLAVLYLCHSCSRAPFHRWIVQRNKLSWWLFSCENSSRHFSND